MPFVSIQVLNLLTFTSSLSAPSTPDLRVFQVQATCADGQRSGSGFLVRDWPTPGQVNFLTALHVVIACNMVAIRSPNCGERTSLTGRIGKGVAFTAWPQFDLAAFSLESLESPELLENALVVGPAPHVGASVHLLGVTPTDNCPMTPATLKGITTVAQYYNHLRSRFPSRHTTQGSLASETQLLVLDVNSEPGVSGGPVVLPGTRQVVGWAEFGVEGSRVWAVAFPTPVPQGTLVELTINPSIEYRAPTFPQLLTWTALSSSFASMTFLYRQSQGTAGCRRFGYALRFDLGASLFTFRFADVTGLGLFGSFGYGHSSWGRSEDIFVAPDGTRLEGPTGRAAEQRSMALGVYLHAFQGGRTSAMFSMGAVMTNFFHWSPARWGPNRPEQVAGKEIFVGLGIVSRIRVLHLLSRIGLSVDLEGAFEYEYSMLDEYRYTGSSSGVQLRFGWLPAWSAGLGVSY